MTDRPDAETPDRAASKVKRQTAFEQHVIPELELLHRTARSLAKSASDADDLVQETLMRAYRAIDRFDGRYPKAWLLTIMRNSNINRATKKTPDLLGDPEYTFEHTTTFADHDDPEALVTDPIFDSLVEHAYWELPDDFREVIELVDLGGLPYAEAASKLGIPVGTVMSRLHRGRKRIRHSLEESGFDRPNRETP